MERLCQTVDVIVGHHFSGELEELVLKHQRTARRVKQHLSRVDTSDLKVERGRVGPCKVQITPSAVSLIHARLGYDIRVEDVE